jgi:hypothetical protein
LRNSKIFLENCQNSTLFHLESRIEGWVLDWRIWPLHTSPLVCLISSTILDSAWLGICPGPMRPKLLSAMTASIPFPTGETQVWMKKSWLFWIRTLDLWISSWHCYQLNHLCRNGAEISDHPFFSLDTKSSTLERKSNSLSHQNLCSVFFWKTNCSR